MTGDEPHERVVCNTTKGLFVAKIIPRWSPLGAERYLKLVDAGYWDGVSFFRVAKDFIVQFGIAADPEVHSKFREWGTIADDPNIGIPFERGTMSFAGGGDNSRDLQIFISYGHSDHLGKAPWETAFGEVVEGMDVVSAFYNGYGELRAFGGNAPDNDRMHLEGAKYIRAEYPLMDYIHTCERESVRAKRLALTESAAATTALPMTEILKQEAKPIAELKELQSTPGEDKSDGAMDLRSEASFRGDAGNKGQQVLQENVLGADRTAQTYKVVPLFNFLLLLGVLATIGVIWIRRNASKKPLRRHHRVL